MGIWEFTYANSALAIATWAFLIGGAVGLFVGPKEGIAAIVIGNIIGVVLTALATCVPAGKYGAEQFVVLRSQFGPNGSRLVYVLAVVFLTMGWLAVLAMMFGRSIDGMTALVSGAKHPHRCQDDDCRSGSDRPGMVHRCQWTDLDQAFQHDRLACTGPADGVMLYLILGYIRWAICWRCRPLIRRSRTTI